MKNISKTFLTQYWSEMCPKRSQYNIWSLLMNPHMIFAFATFPYGSYFYLFFIHVRTCIWKYLQNTPDMMLKWNMPQMLPIQYLITFNESSHDLRFCYFSLRILFLFVSSYSSICIKIFPKHPWHNVKVKYVPNTPNTIFGHF